MKKSTNDISIESLAQYTLDQKHPGSKLDFDKQVERIAGYANFMLRVYANDNKLIRVYLVSAGRDPINKTEQPFRENIMGYFRKYKTDPADNYYIFRILLDKNNKPASDKSFIMPDEFRQ